MSIQTAQQHIDADFYHARNRSSDAGDWLFSGRKWIDPSDPDGRTKLDLHHHNLCLLYPAFAAACSCDELVAAVAAVIERWSRHGRRSAE
jgi:hypothetical protein